MVLFLSAEGSRAACRSALARHNMSCHSGEHENCFFDCRSAMRLRSWPPPHRAKRALGTPGLRRRGVGAFFSLPGTCTRFALAQLVLHTGLFSVAPFGAALSRSLNLSGSRLHFRGAIPLFLRCDCGRLTGGVSGLGWRGPQKPVSKETVSRAFLGLRPIARVFACVEFWHCKLHASFFEGSEFILRVCRSACRKGLNLILPGGQQSHY
jgi:hypothetical protein